MTEVAGIVRLSVEIFAESSVGELAELTCEIEKTLDELPVHRTSDCTWELVEVDPVTDDALLAQERAAAREAFVDKQFELLERGLKATDPEAWEILDPYMRRLVLAEQGFHVKTPST